MAATLGSADSPLTSSTPEPRTLSVYIFATSYIESQIRGFASQYPGVTVNIQDTNDGNQFNETLATEMMSGIAPDIIFGLVNNEYGERGLLTDFKALMANDTDFDASRYIGNVLKNMEDTNGSIYAFPYLFSYEGLISVNTSAPTSIISDFTSRNGICLDDILQAYAGLSDAGDLKVINDLKYIPFDLVYPSYIDYANKTCDLTNPDLIQTMKYMKMYQITNDDTSSSDSVVFQDDSALAKQYLYHYGYFGYPQYFLPFDSNHYERPIPLTDQNGNVFVYTWTMSVYNGSTNKELAWELVKYLTNDTVQCSLAANPLVNPVTVEAFARMMSFRINQMVNDAVAQGSNLTDDTLTAEQNALAAYTAINDMPMVSSNKQSKSVNDIISTEFNNYLSGATTAEQAAANMQNKVELYLNE